MNPNNKPLLKDFLEKNVSLSKEFGVFGKSVTELTKSIASGFEHLEDIDLTKLPTEKKKVIEQARDRAVQQFEQMSEEFNSLIKMLS